MREYDLIVGLLTSQLRLVPRSALAAYASALAENEERSLTDYLVEERRLSEGDRDLIVRLVDTIIHANHGDAAAALATFGGPDAAQEAFADTVRSPLQGQEAGAAKTILADRLPHGLPPEIMPETLGRYTRGSEYARGGIGRILLVHDEQIGRDVILKELLPQSGASPVDPTLSRKPGESPLSPMRHSAAMMARFLQEAKVTGQLEHPSIVPVYELGTRKDGQLYYTMKLVRGSTLSGVIKECESPEDRLALLRPYLDICQAMAYAHSKGVIHRDLKPSNIMVGEFGECVVLDWGLAKMQRDSDAHREALERTASQLRLDQDAVKGHQTGSREVLGTPLYMSPEQARGEVDQVAEHSDVYSLGVILFEILTGELPHPWTDTRGTIRRVATVPATTIAKCAPHLPPELAAICDKALAFEAGDRYPTARELAADIQRFLEGAVVSAYSYRAVDLLGRLYRRHRILVNATAAATAAILAVGALSYVNIYRARGAEEAARIVAEERRAEAEEQRALAEDQRERAEEAERRTAREKYVSEIRLADAYIRDFKFQAAEDTLLATDPQFRNIEWDHLIARCNQDTGRLEGHTRSIFAYIAHGGEHILTLSGDQSVRLWDAATDESRFVWNLPDAPVVNGAFSPDDSTVALWTHDDSIHLYDTASGEKGHSWAAHTMRVNICSFSPDGSRLVSAGADRSVRVWNLDNFEVEATIGAADFGDDVVAYYTASGGQLLLYGRGGAVRLFDSATGAPLPTPEWSGRVLARDGGALLLYRDDELLLLAEGDLAERWRAPAPDPIANAAYNADRGRILTGSGDGTLRLRDASDGALLKSFNAGDPVMLCRLTSDATRVVAVTQRGAIQVHDAETGRKLSEVGGHRHNINTVALAPDDAYILTGSVDGTAKRWPLSEPATYAPRAKAGPGFAPHSVAEGGRGIALGAANGRLAVLDLESNTSLLNAQTPFLPGGPPAALSADGAFLGTVLDSFLPVVLSVSDKSVAADLHGHEGYITGMQFNAAGSELATASWDDTARIWDARTGAPLGTLAGHQDTVYSVAFSPGGTHIATASRDGTAIVWDRETLAPLFTIPHGHPVSHCAFSPDGTLVATSGRGETIAIWDVARRAERHTLPVQTSQVIALAFSADGRRLVSQSAPGALAMWDTELGLLLATLSEPGEHTAAWTRFHGADDRVFSASPDGTLWEFVPLGRGATAPIQDPAALATALEAYRAARASRARMPERDATDRETDLYLPASQITALIGYLRDLNAQRPAPETPWKLEASVTTFYPFELREGDIITTIANMAPAALFGTDNAAVLQPLLSGERPFNVDVLREEVLTRVRLHGLPLRESQRAVTLAPARAAALLRVALDTIQGDATTLLQVNRQRALPGTDPDRGLQVPTPRSADRKALLREAGLESLTRLIEINGEPVPDLDGLADLIGVALAYLETNASFDVRLRLERGAFEIVELALQSNTTN